MSKRTILAIAVGFLLAMLGMQLHPCFAAPNTFAALPGIDVHVISHGAKNEEVSSALKILLGMTILTLAPAILVSMTSFIRITIVLSMLRHAFGMQETPPNTVLVSLALFLTLFTMMPVINQVNDQAFEPFMNGKIEAGPAFQLGLKPVREFMIRQTREQDLSLMVELAKQPEPKTMDDIPTVELIPAYMLSELRSAFQIGFVIFLPFLLIDLLTSTILMSLGMMMVPPVTISLPVKVLMFVLIDGWNLVVKALVGTFQ
ncbi:flagellar type III secretion system pore protein FliP [Solimicrobium silvestre]|uniref:Flagellar biosynthetic protein FliP n=1 Tax=Solimicrobium silvestre TaxID=2099400 RepID=A0A2S9H1Q7_9BURK|nr:flagellar type III secretion system pore protein FliP [Solimicrobium silvestre]PRC93921.1 fliP: flagellar biosynthetic protein FliP [Solimicrobium silvestre]